ncbi:ly6/PLAUR domain-containing protein 2-like [Ascaphus truei]|uniref:ly6/PLAUR domain-containing protein 2-like n=1 Tax=Ascaphus truei TaxID=8439 RepID=UPI003F5945F2
MLSGGYNMKGLLVCLGAAALLYDLAVSLSCYLCQSQTESRDCIDIKNCTEGFKICKTTVYSPDIGYPFQGNELVVRDCAHTCIESDPNTLGQSRPVFCCTTDLCNNRGLYTSNSPATVTPSYRALTLCMGSVIALLRTEL